MQFRGETVIQIPLFVSFGMNSVVFNTWNYIYDVIST
jgi:hypothetical protein